MLTERQRIIWELKALTKTSTVKQLQSVIGVWEKHSDPKTVREVDESPNREKAVLKACKELRITYGANFSKLFASLNRFRTLHGHYLYLNAMLEAHEKNRTLLVPPPKWISPKVQGASEPT